MKTHKLKSWMQYFGRVLDGTKPFETRFNDRDYQVNDLLQLQEWDPESKTYTGREACVQVTYVMEGGNHGIEDNFVVLGIKPWNGTPAAKWRVQGLPDPHEIRYDCERSGLCMGDMTDDELANLAFLNFDRRPPVQELVDGKAFMPIVYMTAVKDRIRWLSRKLIEALQTKPTIPDPSLPPLGDGERKPILIEVNVPADWENRLDMQWVLEREIHADRWMWRWPVSTNS